MYTACLVGFCNNFYSPNYKGYNPEQHAPMLRGILANKDMDGHMIRKEVQVIVFNKNPKIIDSGLFLLFMQAVTNRDSTVYLHREIINRISFNIIDLYLADQWNLFLKAPFIGDVFAKIIYVKQLEKRIKSNSNGETSQLEIDASEMRNEIIGSLDYLTSFVPSVDN